MPDPKSLRVGDRVRFVGLPEEWSKPDEFVDDDDVEFMKRMIARTWPARIAEIDERGSPWIWVRLKVGGTWEHHSWAIVECTGWRLVRRRA